MKYLEFFLEIGNYNVSIGSIGKVNTTILLGYNSEKGNYKEVEQLAKKTIKSETKIIKYLTSIYNEYKNARHLYVTEMPVLDKDFHETGEKNT